jgi:dimethylaniline monooxygenase (N-oxide forming)
MARVCVIGAGSSGVAACQVLNARGISFDCFEAGSEVGGNWRYHNDNGMSSAYRSLRANSSRDAMQYATFPIPDTCPDYLDHAMVARYLDDFVDHFSFRGRIRFRTAVTRVEPAGTGGWDVTARHRDTGVIYSERYASVLVANGHHWNPRYPEPAFPGASAFSGTQLHSHGYRTLPRGERPALRPVKQARDPGRLPRLPQGDRQGAAGGRQAHRSPPGAGRAPARASYRAARWLGVSGVTSLA